MSLNSNNLEISILLSIAVTLGNGLFRHWQLSPKDAAEAFQNTPPLRDCMSSKKANLCSLRAALIFGKQP